MRAITGKYLSFPLLQDYIANLKADREVELFALAFLFKGLRGEKNESWNRLADRFFKVYSDELYRYCGYETETPGFARVWVARPDLFMVYMGGDDEGRHYRGLLVRPDGRSCGPHLRHGKYGKHRFEQVEGATSGGRFDRGRDESGI